MNIIYIYPTYHVPSVITMYPPKPTCGDSLTLPDKNKKPFILSLCKRPHAKHVHSPDNIIVQHQQQIFTNKTLITFFLPNSSDLHQTSMKPNKSINMPIKVAIKVTQAHN